MSAAAHNASAQPAELLAAAELQQQHQQQQQLAAGEPWVQGVLFDVGGTLKHHSASYDGSQANRALVAWLREQLLSAAGCSLDTELFLTHWQRSWKDTRSKKDSNFCGTPEHTARLILLGALQSLGAENPDIQRAIQGLLREPETAALPQLDHEEGEDAPQQPQVQQELVQEELKQAPEAAPRFQNLEALIDEALDVYYTHEMEHSQLFPGIFAMLDAVRAQGRRMAIVTNAADTAKQRRLMKTLGLDRYFTPAEVVISADIRHRKPDSRIFRKVLDEVWGGEIPAARVVMVGDMLSRDVLGARYCGMLSVMVRRAKADRRNQICAEQLGLEPDVVIDRMSQLPEALLQIDEAARIHLQQQLAQAEAGAGAQWPVAVRRGAFAEHRKLRIGFGVPKTKLPRMQASGLFDTRFREDIEYNVLDLGRLLETPGLSELDIVVVKVTDLMARSMYLLDQESMRQLADIGEFLRANPEIPILGVGAQLSTCVSRWKTLELLERLPQPEQARRIQAAGGLPDGEPMVPLAPPSIHVPEHLLLEADPARLSAEHQLELFDRLSGIRYPVICKSVVACGLPCSHVMVLATGPAEECVLAEPDRQQRRARLQELLAAAGAGDAAGLAPVMQVLRPTDAKLFAELHNQVLRHQAVVADRQSDRGPAELQADADRLQTLAEQFPVRGADNGWIVQEYLKHAGRLFKVYVVGERVRIMRQSTLPDLDADSEPRVAVFDTQVVKEIMPEWDALVEGSFAPGTKVSKELEAKIAAQAQPSVPMRVTEQARQDIEWMAHSLLKALGLDLFGFDVLLTSAGHYRVVDINYFPSYTGVEHFAEMFADLLWKRVLDIQAQRMK